MSLFGEPVPEIHPERRLKAIRQAMLDSLTDLDESHHLARIWAKVLYAPDIQALWYLRSDIMTLLASLLGESIAHARLSPITFMFNGLLPAAQMSRPSRLNR